MRTVTLESILLRAWQRAGNAAENSSNIPAATKTMMVAAAAERIADAWEFSDWPELTNLEPRVVQGDTTTGFYLDLEQSQQTPIGTVFGIFRDNPRTHVAPRELFFTLLGDEIRFPEGDVPATVYVRYRTRPDGYSASNLAATVPAILAKAVGLQLTADLVLEDGQYDKSMALELQAENELIKQRDQYVFQQQQPTRWTARMNY